MHKQAKHLLNNNSNKPFTYFYNTVLSKRSESFYKAARHGLGIEYFWEFIPPYTPHHSFSQSPWFYYPKICCYHSFPIIDFKNFGPSYQRWLSTMSWLKDNPAPDANLRYYHPFDCQINSLTDPTVSTFNNNFRDTSNEVA